ncbi:MAG: hypothetical protein ACLFUZ_05330 [Candidatus Micrarchaeia archaeon]
MPKRFQESKLFQNSMQMALEKYFGNETPVKAEWPSFLRQKNIYSPRVDIAVGPFSTEDDTSLSSRYNSMANTYSNLIDGLIDKFRSNLDEFRRANRASLPLGEIPSDHAFFGKKSFNDNARCFIAIEIERSGSKKHMLGDIVNSSSLGRIGLIVAWDAKRLKSFLRMLEYWNFLKSKGKPSFDSRNVLVITKDQLVASLQKSNTSRMRTGL